MSLSKDEVVDRFYGWKVASQTNQNLFRASSAVAGLSLAVAFLA